MRVTDNVNIFPLIIVDTNIIGMLEPVPKGARMSYFSAADFQHPKPRPVSRLDNPVREERVDADYGRRNIRRKIPVVDQPGERRNRCLCCRIQRTPPHITFTIIYADVSGSRCSPAQMSTPIWLKVHPLL